LHFLLALPELEHCFRTAWITRGLATSPMELMGLPATIGCVWPADRVDPQHRSPCYEPECGRQAG